MAFDPDGWDGWDLICILKRVKVSKPVRAMVLKLEEKRRTTALDYEDERWLRQACRKASARIEETLRAEERARLSMAVERRGLTVEQAIKRIEEDKRLQERRANRTKLKLKISKYGF